MPALLKRSALRLVAAACSGLVLVEAAAAVSFQQERDLGRQFDLALRREVPMVTDPEAVTYVGSIGKKIAATLDGSFFDYRFAVVRDPNVNAFAVPGGYIYVHAGLLARADSDDEVAGVLGHETAHVHAHHLARQQEATQLMNYAALLGMLASIVQPAVAPIVSGANAAVSLKYRREFEQEADYLGVRYVRNAGYDPHAVLDFFQKLAVEQRTQSALVPPYLQSHPMTDERLNHLEAILRSAQWERRDRAARSLELLRVQVIVRSRLGPPLEVVSFYRRWRDDDPSDPMRQYAFGLAALEANQVDAAEGPLAEAFKAGVTAAERELGRLALRRRDAPKARALLERYLEREPSDARAQAELGKALQVSGETEAALAAYRRALALAPDFEWAHAEVGLLAGRGGNEADGFYHLATAARLSGDYEKALSQYARAEPLIRAGDPRADEVRQSIEALSEFLRVSAPGRTPGARFGLGGRQSGHTPP